MSIVLALDSTCCLCWRDCGGVMVGGKAGLGAAMEGRQGRRMPKGALSWLHQGLLSTALGSTFRSLPASRLPSRLPASKRRYLKTRSTSGLRAKNQNATVAKFLHYKG